MPLKVSELEITSSGLSVQELLSSLKGKWIISGPARRIIESDLFAPTSGVTSHFVLMSRLEIPPNSHFRDIEEDARKRGYLDMSVESTLLLLQKYGKEELGGRAFMVHHKPLHFSLNPGQQKRYYRLLIRPTTSPNVDIQRCNKELAVTSFDNLMFQRS